MVQILKSLLGSQESAVYNHIHYSILFVLFNTDATPFLQQGHLRILYCVPKPNTAIIILTGTVAEWMAAAQPRAAATDCGFAAAIKTAIREITC